MSANSAKYWEYYGLTADPFSPVLLPTEPLYVPESWEEQVETLLYLCRQRNALLAMLGESGIGKQTFLRFFLSHFDQTEVLICRVVVESSWTFQHFVSELAASLSVSVLTQSIKPEDVLKALHLLPKPVLLVIEDAEKLNVELLSNLLELIAEQSEANIRLHIFLSGCSALRQPLNFIAEKKKIRELLHLFSPPAFSLSDSKKYLVHRLESVGVPAGSPFSEKEIRMIHQRSRGMPATLHTLAQEVLVKKIKYRALNAVAENFNLYKAQIMGTLLFLIVLIGFSVWFAKHSHFPKVTPGQSVEVTFQSPQKNPAILVPVVRAPVIQQPVIQEKIIAASHPSPMIPAVKAMAPALPPAQKVVHRKQNLHVAQRQSFSLHELLTANPNHYTLQLIGLSHKDTMLNFIQTNHLQNRAAYYETSHQGKDWYILVYGEYSSLQEAQLAVSYLPKDLKTYGVWPRKVGNIQEAIARNQ